MYLVLCFIICFFPLLYGMPKTTNRFDLPVTAVEIPTKARISQQAASVTVHYLNYRYGSPNRIYELHKLKKAYTEVILNKGHKYYLEFEVKNQESASNVTATCTAKVLFHKKKNPGTALKCNLKDQMKDSFEKDNRFYINMQEQKYLMVGYNIPDNFGFVDPKMTPIWLLAKVSASYIIWKKSTDVMNYNMVQIQKVNQLRKTDTFLQFVYIILLHELPTQGILTCSMWVMWHPKQPLIVKYFCSTPPSESFPEESRLKRFEGLGSERSKKSRSERSEELGLERSEGSGSERSEGSGSERSEGSGSERSEGSGSERSEGSGSERSEGSGSERSEGSGSERSKGSGSERSKGSGSERSKGSGSERSKGSGSERSKGSGSERSKGSGSERSKGSGFERSEGSGFERSEGSGFERSEGSGFERSEGSGFKRSKGSGFKRSKGSGLERFEGSGSERVEESESERFEGSAMEGLLMN
ncbi:latexin [Mustelus asterias]